jgi:hypothetical protein
MSEILNAEVTELPNEQEATEAPKLERKFVLDMTFDEQGIHIDTRTNLSPLEQLGAIEIFKMNILNQSMSSKES